MMKFRTIQKTVVCHNIEVKYYSIVRDSMAKHTLHNDARITKYNDMNML